MDTLDPTIMKLKNQYSGGYKPDFFSAHADRRLRNDGFIGSDHTVFLSSYNEITHTAPACIAAPLVTMTAGNVINLGSREHKKHPLPVRLYVPDKLCITTKYLSIGDIEILKKPQHGFVSCKKLTLLQFTKEAPPHFEIVLSWINREDTQVDVLHI